MCVVFLRKGAYFGLSGEKVLQGLAFSTLRKVKKTDKNDLERVLRWH